MRWREVGQGQSRGSRQRAVGEGAPMCPCVSGVPSSEPRPVPPLDQGQVAVNSTQVTGLHLESCARAESHPDSLC